MKYTELTFHSSTPYCCGKQTEQLGKIYFFLFTVMECRQRVSPFPKPTKRFWSSPLSASMSKLWMGIVFLNCQQLGSRLPTFLLCMRTLCQVRVKLGTMTVWSHKAHFWRQPHTSQTPQDTSRYSAKAKVLFTYSSSAPLLDSSFSSKSPQQGEDESSFQRPPVL